MKQKSPFIRSKLLLLAGVLALSTSAPSQNPSLQVFEEWSSAGGTINFFQKNRTITDASGNVYITGTTFNIFGNYDILTAKYSSTGTLLWQQVYAGSGGGDDGGADVITDASGNVYITGSYYKNSTDSNNAITIKYNSSGVQQWTNEYNGAGSRNDGTVRLEIDGSYIYAVGSTYTGTTDLYDFLVIKYSLSGTQQWASVWDNAGLMDGAVRIKVKNNKVTVAGGSQVSLTQYKYAVANFAVSNGAFQNAHTSGGNQAISFDKVTDLLVDNNGDVFATGGVQNTGAGYDIRTIKLDQQNLSIQWTKTYNGSSNLDDIGNSIAQDANGDVYVTGYETVTGQDKNYVTIKYANSNGNAQWTNVYNDPYNGIDEAVAIAVQGTSRVYVTGSSYNGSTLDYYTISYNASNGNVIWEIGFNGLANKDDRAADLAITGTNELIVTGTAYENPFSAKYITVKYVEKILLMPQDTIPYTSNSFIYTENRGQVWGTDSATHPEVKYYVINSMPKIYLMDTAVSYVFANLDTSSSSSHIDTLSRVDMKFVNANSNLSIRAMDERDDYENFFLGHIPEGRSKVPNYNQLVSFNVWNNVDIIYGSNLVGMKYYFICKPGGGGNPATLIDLFYDGADSVGVGAGGELIIYTPLGNIVQPKAAAWQLDANGNYQSLGWQPSYTITGTNEVKFTGFGTFNSALPLIIAIDWGNVTPTTNNLNLVWSTFYGGGTHDKFYDLKVTNAGKQFVCGATPSISFPTTVNAFQTANNAGVNTAVVVAFHQDNSRYWATYFGGSTAPGSNPNPSTIANAIDVDKNGDVWFTGSTNTTDFPTQPMGGAYFQNGGLNNGCSACTLSDAIVVKLSSNGQNKLWSTWYGGDGEDIGFDVTFADQSPYDWYFGGSSTSTNFPFPNSLPAWSSGQGFFVHSDFGAVPGFGSYVGASGSGVVYGIAVDQNRDPVLVGKVGGGSGFTVIEPSSGNTGNSIYGGGTSDAFIMKLQHNLNPNIIWSTYWGGTGADEALGIVTTPSGSSIEYYVTGTTTSFTSVPPLFDPGNNAYYQGTAGGGYNDAFVLLADVNGNLPWATFYGGNDDDQGEAITLDDDRNIYAVGKTWSSDLSTATFPNPNLSGVYVDNSLNGVTDGYFACFRHDTYEPVWATYYGGGLQDHLSSVDCDGNSAVYVVGSEAGTSSFPLYSGPGCTNAGTPYTDFSWAVPAGGLYAKGSIAEFCLDNVLIGTHDQSQSSVGVSVYPNPTDNTIWITGTIFAEGEIVISVLDLLGQTVYQEKQAQAATINQQIDVSAFAEGVYLVQVSTGDQCFTQKLIIQR
jgi:hypothetical protein